MQLVAPAGPMYQAGTLSGNPLAMSAGIATLNLIRDDQCWTQFDHVAAKLEAGISSAAKQARVPIQQTRVGTMFTTFFSETKPMNWNTVKVADKVQFAKFFRSMLENKIYLAPSQFEAGFLSILHTEAIIGQTLAAVEETFRAW
jgi:glutamate-1-semialdehyde 2,1-aminomutase